MTVNTKTGQSLLDVSVEHTGSIDAFIYIMRNNGVSDLNYSGELIIDSTLIKNQQSVSFFTQNDSPATAISETTSQGAFSISFNQSFN